MKHEKDPIPYDYQKDEAVGKKEFKRKFLTTRKKIAALGAIGLTLVTVALLNDGAKSGEVHTFGPIQEGEAVYDDEAVILDWNIRNELSSHYNEIEDIVEEEDVDAAVFQEANIKDAEGLKYVFPTAQINFIQASGRDGGFGNVIISFTQKQEDVISVSIKGNSLGDAAVKTAEGIVTDVVNLDTDFKNTKDGTQEMRSAGASTLQIQQGDELVDWRLITGHVGSPYPELARRQYRNLLDFIYDNTKEGQAAVFCGDVNQANVGRSFFKAGLFANKTGPTHANGLDIDHCGFTLGTVFESGQVEVLEDHYITGDHSAILARYKTSP